MSWGKGGADGEGRFGGGWEHVVQRALWFELLCVLAVFLLALAVRVYRLHVWPPGLFNDEAAYGLDALAVLEGARPIFFPRNTGREPLFPYLEALSMALLGPTPYALRLTAAVIGALAVPAAYWMVRELFWGAPAGRRVALWSALFMALGYWHISLSRIAFRANLLPLLAAVTFALFWRAWRTLLQGARMPWFMLVLTGLALGVTLYTYTAGRFMPILLALMVGATLLQDGDRRGRLRALGALATIAVTSALVFAPLGWYFVQHPAQFAGRAASVSFLSEGFSGGNPLLTLSTTIGKLGLLFLTLGDPNLRHNPGQQPAFDLLLGLWFYAGLILCLVQWRRLPYLFLALWVLLLALPAVLTPEGAPHSLRAIGMIPAVYVLPVVAMVGTAAYLGRRVGRRWRRLLAWLPLPFLLLSAFVSLRGYFGAWGDINGFTGVFMMNYGQLARNMAAADAEGLWIMPLSPNYFLVEPQFYAMDFATAGKANFAGVAVDPDVAPAQLTAALAGRERAQLLRARNSDQFPEAGYILDDPKHLIKFLLDKYGVLESEQDENAVGMTYLQYRLPASAGSGPGKGEAPGAVETAGAGSAAGTGSAAGAPGAPQVAYAVFGDEQPAAVVFDGQVALTAASYGRTAQAAAGVDVNSRAVPAGEPVWVTLRWRAEAPIDRDLKTSLSLRSAAGHTAGQVDDLLVGDRYPVARVWEAGEETATYHIVPALPGVPPGHYDLVLRVYDEQTQRPYPVLGEGTGSGGSEAVIGSIEITPAASPQAVYPQVVLAPGGAAGAEPRGDAAGSPGGAAGAEPAPGATGEEVPGDAAGSPGGAAETEPAPDATGAKLAAGLRLLGYDLPQAEVGPGAVLPLTLYWAADAALPADYDVRIQLRRVPGSGADDGAADDGAAGGGGADGGVAAGQVQPIGGGAYPTSAWAEGTAIRDWQDLPLPPEMPNGVYTLWVTVEARGQPAGSLALGEVTVAGRPHVFALPPPAQAIEGDFGGIVRLAGLEETLPPHVPAGDTLAVPLVWQVARTTAQPLVRFVHLLGADGRPLAQADGVPCEGACPAASFLPSEMLRDPVRLEIGEETPPGRYTLAVGWYDGETLARLEARDQEGALLPEGLLPLGEIEVTAAPEQR